MPKPTKAQHAQRKAAAATTIAATGRASAGTATAAAPSTRATAKAAARRTSLNDAVACSICNRPPSYTVAWAMNKKNVGGNKVPVGDACERDFIIVRDVFKMKWEPFVALYHGGKTEKEKMDCCIRLTMNPESQRSFQASGCGTTTELLVDFSLGGFQALNDTEIR